MVTFGTVHNWDPGTGSVISWHATPAAREKARQAPISDVPASYQQLHHLRRFSEHAARGLDMARLNIGVWDISGVCDVAAMTEAINAHLRRHDTYHSWFEHRTDGRIVRHTFDDPADIEFAALQRGEMTPTELRAHILATPNPLRWDCFTFGLVQHPDHFTFYMSADHLVIDGMSVGVIFLEIHLTYAALVSGGRPLPLPEPASYHDYCRRQHQHTEALTLQSPRCAHGFDSPRTTAEPSRVSRCHLAIRRCRAEAVWWSHRSWTRVRPSGSTPPARRRGLASAVACSPARPSPSTS